MPFVQHGGTSVVHGNERCLALKGQKCGFRLECGLGKGADKNAKRVLLRRSTVSWISTSPVPLHLSCREAIGAPGMVVLQFAWGGGATNTHLPHNIYQNSFVYPGVRQA